jgi:hypothetical protein
MHNDLTSRLLPELSDPAKKLSPLKLHALLGDAEVWTDALWDDAMTYLDGRISLPQSVNYKTLLYRLQQQAGQHPEVPAHQIAKRGNLAGYRQFEPKLLLAAFDYFRVHGHEAFARVAYLF